MFPVFFASTTCSGTTAVVALYRDDRVWVANAGDSRAVLGTQERESLAEGSSVEVEPSGLASLSGRSFGRNVYFVVHNVFGAFAATYIAILMFFKQ